MLLSRTVRGLVGFVFLLPIFGLAHEMLVIIAARSVKVLADSDLLYRFVKQFVASPVHARILLETLGGIEPRGIAVAGLPGELLHTFASFAFADPNTVASSAWISALVSKNSTVLGFFATQMLVEFTVLVIGGLILQSGLRQRSPRQVWRTAPVHEVLLVVAGLLMISEAVWAAFRLTLSPDYAGLQETGLGVGFSLLFQVNSQQYNWLMEQGLPLLIPMFVTAAGIGISWFSGKLVRRIHAHFTRLPRTPRRFFGSRVKAKVRIAALLIPFLSLTAVMPGSFGIAKTAPIAAAPQVTGNLEHSASEAAAIPTAAATTATPLPDLTATPPTRSVPSVIPVFTPKLNSSPTPTADASPTPIRQHVVQLQRNGSRFVLVVNNQPTYVTGMNYNVNYTGRPDELKRRFHRRDFQILHAAGVNAVIGWGVYDQATLDVAREYDVGVFMPFDLDAKGPFENKIYREHIKSQFREFVLAYKDAPAVWGWNPGGDELLHRMETEHHRTPDKLQDASDFLLELSTLAFSIDPTHVSIVKEPRDAYVAYIEDSVRRARLQKPAVDPNRYFVFAMNTYGKPEGVAAAIDTTRESVEGRVGIAFLVGEFAPFGLARSERSAQYVQIWKSVRAKSSLGGFAYVFGPDQPNPQAPNPYDPLRLLVNEFSLVDIEGRPVDGSLSALGNEWNAIAKQQ